MHNLNKLDIPRFSQIADVTDPSWKNRACGPACLAMLIAWYLGDKNSNLVNEIIEKGQTSGAYIEGKGWLHKGLAELASDYGLKGQNFDWSKLGKDEARKKLMEFVKTMSIIASVAKDFSPSLDGHMVVVREVNDKKVLISDPFRQTKKDVSYSVKPEHFWNTWTQRVIVVEKSCPF